MGLKVENKDAHIKVFYSTQKEKTFAFSVDPQRI